MSKLPTIAELDADLTDTIDRLHAAEIAQDAASFLILTSEVDVLLELRWLLTHTDGLEWKSPR